MRSTLAASCFVLTVRIAGLGFGPAAAKAAGSSPDPLAPEIAPETDTKLFSDDLEWGNVCHWSSTAGSADSCPYDLSCAGVPAPTTAPDPLSASGTLLPFGSTTPIAGASLTSRLRSNDSVLDSDTTAADGTYSFSAATGGVPLDLYVKVVAASYPETDEYPAEPVAADVTGLGLRAMSTTTLNTVYALGGAAGPPVVGAGTAIVIVQDCAGAPIVGATVQISPSPDKIGYTAGSGVPSPSATSTSSDGLVYGYGVPAGEVTISANKTGMTFQSHEIGVTAAGVSVTTIHP